MSPSPYEPLSASADTPYEPLLARDEHEDSPIKRAHAPPPSLRAIVTTPRLALIASVLISLVLSAVNLTFLSARSAFNEYTVARAPRKTPSVYLGLDKLHWDPPRCRRRTIFPTKYARFSGRDVRQREHVHGPQDEVVFQFGGKENAHVTFYVPDYGLENCTLSFRTVLGSMSTRDSKEPSDKTRPDYMAPTTSMKVDTSSQLAFSLLSNKDSLAKQLDLGTFPLAELASGDGGTVTTKPFYCASRQDMSVLVQCVGCDIRFGLEGMTTATSSATSRNKTGFRITQYEGLECID